MPALPPPREIADDEQDCPAASLWLVMMKSYRSVQMYVERSLAGRNIGLSDFMILEALLHKGAMKMSLIGSTVLLANPSMTAAIARLEKLGLVTRQDGAEDRRVRTVTLTAQGRKLIRKVYAQHERDLETVMAGIPAQQRQTARAVLKCIGLAAKARLDPARDEVVDAATAE